MEKELFNKRLVMEDMEHFVLELENTSIFYLNVFSNKEAALKALLKSDEENSDIRHLTNERTGRKISNIKLEYDNI